jgi:hypothetical protein
LVRKRGGGAALAWCLLILTNVREGAHVLLIPDGAQPDRGFCNLHTRRNARANAREIRDDDTVRAARSVEHVPTSYGFCPGVTPVVVSLLAYFFYIIVAFSAITALLIGLSNESTVQDVMHYPRPIFDQAAIVSDPGAWQAPNAPNASQKEQAPARDKRDDKIDSGAIAVAKVDAPKRNRETKRNTVKFAHLQKPRATARQRERQDRGYAVAFGNSGGYRPGLDSQR